eukprot:TRINITY_DN3109_c0_g1_i8.p1 TRINITY_DN3109_c0_g1~~TRINITY_DN3109_c0_g1_i8.p1  ORF type:complete len:476 (+),score=147.17 TRINITY_DN3109_c0_g1_i8:841-2268(+)
MVVRPARPFAVRTGLPAALGRPFVAVAALLWVTLCTLGAPCARAQVTPAFGSLGLGREFSTGIEGGTVYVWGTVRPFSTEDVSSLDVYSIAAGSNVACLLLSSNLSVVCRGQDAASDARIADAPTNQSFLQLSAGVQHVCGLTADFDFWDFATQAPRSSLSDAEVAEFESTVRPICWGNGVTSSRGNESFLTPSYIGLPDDPVVDVTVGDSFTCSRTRTGRVNCDGTFGSSGDFDAFENTKDVTDPSFDNREGVVFSTIVAGSDHVCGVGTATNGDVLHCWGSAGRVVTDPSFLPTGSDFQTGPGSVASGSGFSCALRTDRTPVCWGRIISSFFPTTPTTTAFSYITAGAQHVCGIRVSDSSTQCWGFCEHAECFPPEQLAPTTVGCSQLASTGTCVAFARNDNSTGTGMCAVPDCSGFIWDADGECRCSTETVPVWTLLGPTPTPAPGAPTPPEALVFCEPRERLILRKVSCPP